MKIFKKSKTDYIYLSSLLRIWCATSDIGVYYIAYVTNPCKWFITKFEFNWTTESVLLNEVKGIYDKHF